MEQFDPIDHVDREQNKPERVEEDSIELDNLSLLVKILMPSGRLHIRDKVSGFEWNMTNSRSSGSAVARMDDEQQQFSLGLSGQRGVLFKTNFYMMRNTLVDDYHDVSLTGSLGNNPSTLFTVRYLLSNSFPVLYCFCYVAGPLMESLFRVDFPLGFHLPDHPGNRIYLPQDVQSLQGTSGANYAQELWQPDPQVEHLVKGAPFFVMTQSAGERASTCMGFLQHPLSTLEIHRTDSSRYITPSSTRLDVTGISDETPYQVRYQFLPSDDLEAVSWLYHEYLNEEHEKFYL